MDKVERVNPADLGETLKKPKGVFFCQTLSATTF